MSPIAKRSCDNPMPTHARQAAGRLRRVPRRINPAEERPTLSYSALLPPSTEFSTTASTPKQR